MRTAATAATLIMAAGIVLHYFLHFFSTWFIDLLVALAILFYLLNLLRKYKR